MPQPLARATGGRTVITHRPFQPVPRDEGLHRTGEREAEDQRPERLPEHEEALAQAPTDVTHDVDGQDHRRCLPSRFNVTT